MGKSYCRSAGTPGAGSATQLGTLQTVPGTGNQELAITGLSTTINSTTQIITVGIVSSDSGSSTDSVWWVDVEFEHTDPKAAFV